MTKAKKITGFRALYFHYCYLLGIFPKRRRQHRQLPFSCREDLIRAKELSDEVRLVVKHHIDTPEQLSVYQAGVEAEIQKTAAARKQLYKKLRTKAVQADPQQQEEIKDGIAGFTGKLKKLRREAKLCEDIAMRSAQIREKVEAVRKEEKIGKKEQRRPDWQKGQ